MLSSICRFTLQAAIGTQLLASSGAFSHLSHSIDSLAALTTVPGNNYSNASATAVLPQLPPLASVDSIPREGENVPYWRRMLGFRRPVEGVSCQGIHLCAEAYATTASSRDVNACPSNLKLAMCH